MRVQLLALLLLALAPGCETKGGTMPGGGADSEGDTAACVPEVCNGLDDDCDGSVDEEPTDGSAVYADGDGDGHGAGEATGIACEAAAGESTDDGDCDDADADVNPDAAEVCNNGKDDDCDGGANGCQLEGEVQASWAPVKILAGEGDYLADDLQSGDIDGDGVMDLFVVGYLGATATEGAYVFTGPIEEDRPTSEADATFAVEDGTYLYDFDVLDDLDGDGVSEVALGVTDPTGTSAYPSSEEWTELYRGGPGTHVGGGEVRDFLHPLTGMLGGAEPALVATCPRDFGLNGWCGYDDPFGSEDVTLAIATTEASGANKSLLGDLDGDSLDELLLQVGREQHIVWGPLTDTAYGQENVSVVCSPRMPDGAAEHVIVGDTDGDGLNNLVLGDRLAQEVYVFDAISAGGQCVPDRAAVTLQSSSGDSDFGQTLSFVGDLDGDGAADWMAGADEMYEGRGEALLYMRVPAGAHEFEEAATLRILGESSDGSLGGVAVPIAADAFGLLVGRERDNSPVAVFSLAGGR